MSEKCIFEEFLYSELGRVVPYYHFQRREQNLLPGILLLPDGKLNITY